MDLNHDGVFDLNDIILIAVAISAILAAVYALRRQVVKPLSKWVQKQLADFFHSEINPDLLEIKTQLMENGGGTLKDAIVSTRAEMAQMHIDTIATFKERDKRFARLAQPAERRLMKVEDAVVALGKSQSEILGRIEQLSYQNDSEAKKVLAKIDTNTNSIIDGQGDHQ